MAHLTAAFALVAILVSPAEPGAVLRFSEHGHAPWDGWQDTVREEFSRRGVRILPSPYTEPGEYEIEIDSTIQRSVNGDERATLTFAVARKTATGLVTIHRHFEQIQREGPILGPKIRAQLLRYTRSLATAIVKHAEKK